MSLGPKSYSYRVETGEEDVKNKGLTLNVANSKAVNYNEMKELVLGDMSVLKTDNLDFKKQKDGIYSYVQNKDQVFCHTKRHCEGVDTLPFGHSAIKSVEVVQIGCNGPLTQEG